MRHVVIGHRIDLRGMEISSRTRITEILAFRLLIAIVLMEAEVSTAPFVAGFVAVPVCHAARRWLGWPRERVVAADTVDLEGNIVGLCLRVMYWRNAVPAIRRAVALGFERSTILVVTVRMLPDRLMELLRMSMPRTFVPPITG